MISANTATARRGELSREHHDAVSDGSHLELIGEMGPAKNDPVKDNPYAKKEPYAGLGVVYLNAGHLTVADLKVPTMPVGDAVKIAREDQAKTLSCLQKGAQPETVVIAVPVGANYRDPEAIVSSSIELMRQNQDNRFVRLTPLEQVLVASEKASRDRTLATYQIQPEM